MLIERTINTNSVLSTSIIKISFSQTVLLKIQVLHTVNLDLGKILVVFYDLVN